MASKILCLCVLAVLILAITVQAQFGPQGPLFPGQFGRPGFYPGQYQPGFGQGYQPGFGQGFQQPGFGSGFNRPRDNFAISKSVSINFGGGRGAARSSAGAGSFGQGGSRAQSSAGSFGKR